MILTDDKLAYSSHIANKWPNQMMSGYNSDNLHDLDFPELLARYS
jgi:hypothetical protein